MKWSNQTLTSGAFEAKKAVFFKFEGIDSTKAPISQRYFHGIVVYSYVGEGEVVVADMKRLRL